MVILVHESIILHLNHIHHHILTLNQVCIPCQTCPQHHQMIFGQILDVEFCPDLTADHPQKPQETAAPELVRKQIILHGDLIDSSSSTLT